MESFAYLIIAAVALGIAAFLSGLAIGVLSLNSFELRRRSKQQEAEAKLVYPIRARANELRVNLIFLISLFNAIFIIALYELLGGGLWAAIITLLLGAGLILVVGQLLPRIYFKKSGLKFAAKLAPYILGFMEVTRPIASRLGFYLDRTIGAETPALYTADEMQQIIEEHRSNEFDSKIAADGLAIVQNALNFGDKQVSAVMTPKSVIKAIASDEEFTTGLLKDLADSGHSRFPVFDGDLNNVVGILYLRELIAGHREGLKAGKAADRAVHFVNEFQPLDHVLNAFIKTKKHMFIVVNEFGETTGLITIEDILEEIIGREIVDEFDKFDDLREVARMQGKKRTAKKIIGEIK